MSEHTPTPWHLGRNGGVYADTQFSRVFADGSGTARVCLSCDFPDRPGEDDANEAFIVRAVNHHDALVAALRAALDYIRGCVDVWEDHLDWLRQYEPDAWELQAEAVLAAVEEQP